MKVYYYRIALNLSRKYRKFDYIDCNLIYNGRMERRNGNNKRYC